MQRTETRSPAAGDGFQSDSLRQHNKQPEAKQPPSPGIIRARSIGPRLFEVVEPPDGADVAYCWALDNFGLPIERVCWHPDKPHLWRVEKGIAFALERNDASLNRKGMPKGLEI